MRFFVRFLAVMLVPAAFGACKTTEANYRAAYEKTIEAQKQQAALDSTIYGTTRRSMGTARIETPDGPVDVRTMPVRITEDGGGFNERLRRYNVVVGQFKQVFNARSFRERLADSGQPSSFVVETAEPYYYIVLASFDKAEDAAKALEAYAANPALPLKEPCPFILDATARRSKRVAGKKL